MRKKCIYDKMAKLNSKKHKNVIALLNQYDKTQKQSLFAHTYFDYST